MKKTIRKRFGKKGKSRGNRRPRPGARPPIPEGHQYCVMCGGSHPVPVTEIDLETGESILIQKEPCPSLKRMARMAIWILLDRLMFPN
jgi:hypothetical protein